MTDRDQLSEGRPKRIALDTSDKNIYKCLVYEVNEAKLECPVRAYPVNADTYYI